MTPRDRLARIADAHHQHVSTHGITSGYCRECDLAWPCPTYIWATHDRDLFAPWDPADDDPPDPALTPESPRRRHP